MKKKYISGISLLILTVSVYAATTLRTDTGFYYPANKTHSQSTYYGYGDRNPIFGNFCHIANDYNSVEGASVYAVGLGEVVSVAENQIGYGSNFSAGGVMVVKHTNSDDTFFYGLYGHIKNITVMVGDTVVGGQKIAEIGEFKVGIQNQPHLHFSVNLNSADINGYTPTSACNDYRGTVDPEPYLLANSPKLSPAETCHAVNDAGSTAQNTIFTTASVLTNDTDTDGDTLTVSAVDATSSNGVVVTNNGDGTFTYTPAIDFSGTDTFQYTLSDGNGCSSEASFTVTVDTDSTGDSSSGGGGSFNAVGLISLFLVFLARRFRKRMS